MIARSVTCRPREQENLTADGSNAALGVTCELLQSVGDCAEGGTPDPGRRQQVAAASWPVPERRLDESAMRAGVPG